MPDISVFCPGCGRPVVSNAAPEAGVPGVAPLSRQACLGAVAYIMIVPAILFLLLPVTRASRFVRFHSWQSLFLAAGTALAGVATRLVFAGLSMFPFLGSLLGWLIAGVVFLAVIFLWVAIVIKAALGDAYELPLTGFLAARLADRQ